MLFLGFFELFIGLSELELSLGQCFQPKLFLIIKDALWVALDNLWLWRTWSPFLVSATALLILSIISIFSVLGSSIVFSLIDQLIKRLIDRTACPTSSSLLVAQTLTLLTQSLLKVLILHAPPALIVGCVVLGHVELDRLAAGGALDLLDEPGAEADQVEHMAAAQLLALLNVAKADAAFVSWSTIFTRSHDIFQLLQLSDELSPFDQR